MLFRSIKRKEGCDYSDFAILYRSNYQARVFETALRRENIPYTISGGQSFFSRAEIRDLIAYLRLIANLDDDPAFIRAITTPRRGVGEGTLSTLGTFAGQWRCPLFEAAYKGGIEAKLPTRQLRPLREFCDFINRIEERAGRPSAKGEPAAELLDELVDSVNTERLNNHPVRMTKDEIRNAYIRAMTPVRENEKQACMDIWRYYGRN